MEVIVIDDGSNETGDGVLSVIPAQAGIQKNGFPPIKSGIRSGMTIKMYHIKHSGASAARNFGFSKSSGKYIFFCDTDVVFLKNDALEKMLKILEENPDKAYCYSSFKYGFKTFRCGEFDAEKLKQNNYISTMSMVRRTALEKIIVAPCSPLRQSESEARSLEPTQDGPFDPSLKRFQDWDLWLTLLEHGETGIWLPEVLWQAKSGGTMSRWLPKIFYKIFKNSEKVKEYERAKNIIRQKHNLKFDIEN